MQYWGGLLIRSLGAADHELRSEVQRKLHWQGVELDLEFGDLWMSLQLMWLQSEVVRSPVGLVWVRFGAGLGPKRSRLDFGQPQIAAT